MVTRASINTRPHFHGTENRTRAILSKQGQMNVEMEVSRHPDPAGIRVPQQRLGASFGIVGEPLKLGSSREMAQPVA